MKLIAIKIKRKRVEGNHDNGQIDFAVKKQSSMSTLSNCDGHIITSYLSGNFKRKQRFKKRCHQCSRYVLCAQL